MLYVNPALSRIGLHRSAVVLEKFCKENEQCHLNLGFKISLNELPEVAIYSFGYGTGASVSAT